MCSREDVRLPAHRQASRSGLHRSLSPVNVICLLLGVVSTAISLGSLLVQRSGSSHAALAKGSERTLAVDGEQELSRKIRFFQGLKSLPKGNSKLVWRGDPEDGSSHTIAEKGGYNVYAQITFKGNCSDKDILLTITLCKKERRVKEKELLMTSLSVCEGRMDIKWIRTLSQAAIFYFEEGDEIYINTTSMQYVEFRHSYNNIFGIYRI